MPRRTRSHVIGDIAVSRVIAICNELGWACEPVQKDYGEDLWIQTTIGEKVDHHRIWFQVKATDNIAKYKNRRGEISYTVDLHHALRWVRSLELVVFILWDIENNIGYWTLPRHNVTDWDLLSNEKKRSKLMFSKRDKFTVSTGAKLSWIARIYYFQTLLAVAQQEIIQYERESKIGLDIPEHPHKRMNLICYDFLRSIKFLQEDGSIDNFIGRKVVKEMERALSEKSVMSDIELCLTAVTLVVLGQVKKLSNYGLPGFLLWESVRFGASLLHSRIREAGLPELHRCLSKMPNNSFNPTAR